MGSATDYIQVSQYPCVYEVSNKTSTKSSMRQATFFQAKKKIHGKWFRVSGKTAKSAALALDRKLIESGLEPINVLKRVV